jgi:hypothetical protein
VVWIATTASTGVNIGKTTRKRMRISPAPSMRAASSQSVGDSQQVLPNQEDVERVDQERQA